MEDTEAWQWFVDVIKARAKCGELHDRQSAIRLQPEVIDRNDRDVADLAIKAFELSQSLKKRWRTAGYRSKRMILDIMLESACSNSENIEFVPRKPFNFLQDQNFVPRIGATGTPVELPTAFLKRISRFERQNDAGP